MRNIVLLHFPNNESKSSADSSKKGLLHIVSVAGVAIRKKVCTTALCL